MKNAIVMALVAGFALVGCGGTDAPAADPTKSAVTFEVDLNSKVDGTHELSAVLSGESVYLVGDLGLASSTSTTPGGCDYNADKYAATSTPAEYQAGANNAFPCWKPDTSKLAMTKNSAGNYTITVNLLRGTKLQFKTTKSPNLSCSGSSGKTGKDLIDTCGWSNGPKKYYSAANFPKACSNATATAGLFEIDNYAFTVPDAATSNAPVMKIDAWRDYAAGLGAQVCD
jgi:hypothetical protein